MTRVDAAVGEFEADVLAGLAATPKAIPPKYFYDDRGSRLFEEICRTPEYYPTRTETALLAKIAPEIATHVPAGAALVEFGSGASDKTRLLLDAAPQLAAYLPIDISGDALGPAATRIRARYPRLDVQPVLEDFTQAISLPERFAGSAKVGFFPGSTVGNFDPQDARRFLEQAKRLLGSNALFVVGVDLIKDEATLTAAYNDAAGVTAAFNLNLLARINRDLGGDFDLAAFEHRALWNAARTRMEMHLVSRRAQAVQVGREVFTFAEGESIHTENSYKYDPGSFGELARKSGWSVGGHWIAPPPQFGVFLLQS